MNLDNYYRYFSSHQVPRDAKVHLFDDTHFAIEKDEIVRVFCFQENECEEMTVFFKNQFDFLHVFENGYILTAAKGEAKVFYRGKFCYSFEYMQNTNFCFCDSAVMFTDPAGYRDMFFMNPLPYPSAGELVSTYLGMKDDYIILNGGKSDFGTIFLKICRKTQIEYFVFYPLGGKENGFGCFSLPENVYEVELLKNGNFIVRFLPNSSSAQMGCVLYDFSGKPLLSSDEEYGILMLKDKRHCVYQNALLVGEEGEFIDEYRNELAISKDGYKIYAYTIDFGSKKRKGLWPGKNFKLFDFASNPDLFCFWNNGYFFVVPLSDEFSLPITIHCDKQYAMLATQALGL